jgi:hypothetical protein
MKRAARAGALCMVTRTGSWVPQEGDVIRGLRFNDSMEDVTGSK